MNRCAAPSLTGNQKIALPEWTKHWELWHGGMYCKCTQRTSQRYFMPFCSDEMIKSIVLVLPLTAKHMQHLIFVSFLKCCMDAKIIKSCNSKSRSYRVNLIITEYIWLL